MFPEQSYRKSKLGGESTAGSLGLERGKEQMRRKSSSGEGRLQGRWVWGELRYHGKDARNSTFGGRVDCSGVRSGGGKGRGVRNRSIRKLLGEGGSGGGKGREG